MRPGKKGPAIYGDRQTAIWDAIRDGETFTLAAAAERSKVAMTTVKSYVRRLRSAGYVEECGRDTGATGRRVILYRVVRPGGAAPRLGEKGRQTAAETARQRMWRTMRILKTFTAQDVTMCATVEGGAVTMTTATTYLRYLEWAGYVKRLGGTGKGEGTCTLGTYLLVRNTGPVAPAIIGAKAGKAAVYDHNRKRVVWTARGKEEHGEHGTAAEND